MFSANFTETTHLEQLRAYDFSSEIQDRPFKSILSSPTYDFESPFANVQNKRRDSFAFDEDLGEFNYNRGLDNYKVCEPVEKEPLDFEDLIIRNTTPSL